jgi:hypothetical protein
MTGTFHAISYDMAGAVVDGRRGTLEAVRLEAEPYD